MDWKPAVAGDAKERIAQCCSEIAKKFFAVDLG